MKKGSFIPYIIIATFVLFAIYIGQFVYRSMQTNLNLVREDYYAEEIKHQEKIDLRAASVESNKTTVIELNENNQLNIQFNLDVKIDKAELVLFRPSDGKLDQLIELKISNENNTQLDLSSIKKGAWKMTLNYFIEGISYLKEQDLYIN